MDRTAASYYRSILFNNPDATETLPASLLAWHKFVFNRCQNFGKNNIDKMAALQAVVGWMSTTGEGRKFAAQHPDLRGVFDITLDPDDEDDESEVDATPTGGLANGDPVVVMHNGVATDGRFVFVSKTGLARVVVNGVQKRIPIGDVSRAAPVSG